MDYKNLYWSRLMVIENLETGIQRKWPLGRDIIEEIKSVAEMPQANQEEWAPLFEPYEFNNHHGPLLIDEYKLSKDDLLSWAQ